MHSSYLYWSISLCTSKFVVLLLSTLSYFLRSYSVFVFTSEAGLFFICLSLTSSCSFLGLRQHFHQIRMAVPIDRSDPVIIPMITLIESFAIWLLVNSLLSSLRFFRVSPLMCFDSSDSLYCPLKA